MINFAQRLSTQFYNMIEINNLIQRDLQHIWHPCTQMKDFEQFPPLVIEKAKGNYLYTSQGVLIDAISSWWCKSLGHGHTAVIDAITSQLSRFEHVISANTTHPGAVALAEKLAKITQNQHAYFASDGSSAVEIAMKLAVHATQIKGFNDKREFIALTNGYHGETIATMSVSDLSRFNAPYQGMGMSCHFIEPAYVSSIDSALWSNSDTHWQKIYPNLMRIKERVCAIILEPIVQGAGGMLCYSADFLRKIAQWAKEHDIYLIADEIMTGIGRTGQWLALDHAKIKADMVCLSKGLTSGSIPFSCVMLNHALFSLFYTDSPSPNSFLHSHTYSGNPLGIHAALATIQVIEQEDLITKAQNLGKRMLNAMEGIAKQSQKLTNVRGIGPVVAADLMDSQLSSTAIYQAGLKHGILLRPIGKTIYWMLPLNTEHLVVDTLAENTLKMLLGVY